MDSNTKIQDYAAAAKKVGYPEVESIRGDLRALKTDTVDLGRHVVADGREKLTELAANAKDMAKDEYAELSNLTKEKSRVLASFIKDKPFQGAAAAFLTGFVISMMMRKR